MISFPESTDVGGKEEIIAIYKRSSVAEREQCLPSCLTSILLIRAVQN